MSDNTVVKFRTLTELVFQVERDVIAKVIFYGEVTQEGVRKLETLLAAEEDTFPQKETSDVR